MGTHVSTVLQCSPVDTHTKTGGLCLGDAFGGNLNIICPTENDNTLLRV